jgi:hypothetical protein
MTRFVGATLGPKEAEQFVATDDAMPIRGEDREQRQAPSLRDTADR